MAIAQQLYEGVDIGTEGRVGLITYMRTDSYRVADDAVRACREWITRQYGADFVPPKPPVRAAGRLAQEAHEAIRPTDVRRTPESVRPYLTEEQFRLYRLIWRRFVASQMAPAKYEVTEVVVRSGDTRFRAAGRILRFAGYTQVWPSSQKEQPLLPDLREGDELVLQSLEPTQHFTEPPPRYTEASLVKALEKYGIGRPSTYAPILSTIQERGYVRSEGRTLVPTELGMLVTDLLVRHFAGIVDTGFTAQMEKKLDRIEQARTGWREVLEEFYKVFAKDLERAQEEMKSARAEPAEGEPPCEACGRPMVWRWTTRGRFLACSGYPECRQRRVPAEELAGSPCPVCGAPMRIRRNRLGRYEACTKYPECKFSRPLEYRGRPIRIPEGWTETCPQSGHPMVLRLGRRGPFIACSGYPECKTTRNVPREWMRAGGDDQTQAT
jgi:DNA topoisomerase-1